MVVRKLNHQRELTTLKQKLQNKKKEDGKNIPNLSSKNKGRIWSLYVMKLSNYLTCNP